VSELTEPQLRALKGMPESKKSKELKSYGVTGGSCRRCG
jgi:hypothetical protein